MNETLRTLHSLRSIHGNFSDREVSEGNVRTILNACVEAASASGRQSYSIVVVDDKAVMKKIGYVGSKVLVFCVDYTRLIDLARALGYVHARNGMEDFVTGSSDTLLAAQTAAIAAKSLGIDSLFTNCVHRGDISRAYRLLGLPEEYCFPLIALVLGYPKTEPEHRKKGRLCGPGIVHFGAYHRPTLEELSEIVREYDDPEKHYLSLIGQWKEKGYAHYLEYLFGQWFNYPRIEDNAAFPKAMNSQSAQIVNLLKTAGFLADDDH